MSRSWRRWRSRWKVIGAIAAIVLIATGVPSATAATSTSSTQGALMVSAKADLTDSRRLARSAVRGKVFVYLPSQSVQKVDYFLDDKAGVGKADVTTTKRPFVLTRSTMAGLDTTALKNGTHSVLAVVTTAKGTTDLLARFEVKNPSSSAKTPNATGARGSAVPKRPAAAVKKAPQITGVFYENKFEGGDGEGFEGDKHTEGGGEPSKLEKAPGGGTGNAIMYHGPAGAKRTETYPAVPSNKPGDDKYFQFQIYFPETFQCYTDDWNIVMQWHGNDEISPPLALDVNSKCVMVIAGNGSPGPRPEIGPIVKGKWTTYTMHIRFGEGDDGFVEAWENGVQKVKKTNRKTMNGGSDYLKMGLYRRPEGSPDQSVYFDNLVFGTGIAGAAGAAK